MTIDLSTVYVSDPGSVPFETGIGVGVDPELTVREPRTGTLCGLDFAYWAARNVDPLQAGDVPEPVTDDLNGTELVEWCAAQVGLTVVPTIDWLLTYGEEVTVERALRTRGAVLLAADQAAVSLGFSQVAQPSGDRYILRVVPEGDTTWTAAVLLPGVRYTAPGPVVVVEDEPEGEPT